MRSISQRHVRLPRLLGLPRAIHRVCDSSVEGGRDPQPRRLSHHLSLYDWWAVQRTVAAGEVLTPLFAFHQFRKMVIGPTYAIASRGGTESKASKRMRCETLESAFTSARRRRASPA